MSNQHLFEEFPKMARLSRECVITEKIDGTNAAIIILPTGREGDDPSTSLWSTKDYTVFAQSRTRLITPADDNFGFARWVAQTAERLCPLLGYGRHFGEWWGSGIQRGYGLDKWDKRFSLFNTRVFGGTDLSSIAGLGVVPTLFTGCFSCEEIERAMSDLRSGGSRAKPGFMDPEGVVIYHTHAGVAFKKTFVGDDTGKGYGA